MNKKGIKISVPAESTSLDVVCTTLKTPRKDMKIWRKKQASVLLEIEMIVVVQIYAVVEYCAWHGELGASSWIRERRIAKRK